ncbi:MAG: deoxyribonuclease IV, partial [Bacilli bacterium]
MEKGNLIIGSHVSFNKNEQLIGSVKEAISYGATTFMFYTGAPQNSRRYPIDDSKTRQAINLMEKNNIEKENVVIHAPYIANLANIGEKQAFGIQLLKEEINRCSQLGVDKLIIHPGSHVGLGKEQGLKNIINALNELLANTRVIICLETMAGKGTELGINFAEMKT